MLTQGLGIVQSSSIDGVAAPYSQTLVVRDDPGRNSEDNLRAKSVHAAFCRIDFRHGQRAPLIRMFDAQTRLA
jgi:hypothetical protein